MRIVYLARLVPRQRSPSNRVRPQPKPVHRRRQPADVGAMRLSVVVCPVAFSGNYWSSSDAARVPAVRVAAGDHGARHRRALGPVWLMVATRLPGATSPARRLLRSHAHLSRAKLGVSWPLTWCDVRPTFDCWAPNQLGGHHGASSARRVRPGRHRRAVRARAECCRRRFVRPVRHRPAGLVDGRRGAVRPDRAGSAHRPSVVAPDRGRQPARRVVRDDGDPARPPTARWPGGRWRSRTTSWSPACR